MLDILAISAVVLLFLSFCYVVVALVCVVRFGLKQREAAPEGNRPPVTILKPLCGMEVDLEANLRSFCEQEYENFQVVFGVRDSDDPAIEVVNRLKASLPDRDIALVVDGRVIGTNYKIGNLANMMAVAKHDIIAISDSDMRVTPDYLKAITAPFADPAVGAATCLYSGNAKGGTLSKLGAMFVNDWFLPSAVLASMVGPLEYCFGATMVLRRNVLAGFGGFEALADYLADDYMLGQFTVQRGYRIALVPYVVQNVVFEPSLKGLFLHELRWARTIRSVQPVGYAFSFITEILPISLLAAGLLYAETLSPMLAVALLGGAFAMQVALHDAVCRMVPGGTTYAPWLIPVRDLLSLSVRVASYFGSRIEWRDRSFVIRANNQLKAAK